MSDWTRRAFIAGSVAARGLSTAEVPQMTKEAAAEAADRAPAREFEITLLVNDRPHRVKVDAETSLLDGLRDRLRLSDTKKGCALGQCGACTVIGAYDAGRIVNPKIARSQCIGGMVGGIGMGLLEQAEWDARYGRVMNANLAEYFVPVNADVVETEALFVPSEDLNFNPLGAKGLAELALCGVAPAIANAVYHATGKRIRHLPITPEKLPAAT